MPILNPEAVKIENVRVDKALERVELLFSGLWQSVYKNFVSPVTWLSVSSAEPGDIVKIVYGKGGAISEFSRLLRSRSGVEYHIKEGMLSSSAA